jgi:hypothetical protein
MLTAGLLAASRPGAGARFTVVIPTRSSKEVGVP